MEVEEQSISGTILRKKERNKRRRHSNRKKKKIRINETFAKSISLEKELAHTKSRLEQTKMKALELHRALNTPRKCSVATVSSMRFNIQSKPTASSGFRPREVSHHIGLLQSIEVKALDRYSLNSTCDGSNCDVGSGTFGKCTKMLLCATEVAVKATILDTYSYDDIMYEARVMAEVCCGHPNLPLFMGIYDQPEYPKPLLVMKFYSVAGQPCTFHQYLRNERLYSTHKHPQDWARILLGVCNGLKAIHMKGYLHNDLKCNNIVLSDIVPKSNKAPPVWPIIIDFGKARPMKDPKMYKLTEVEKKEYLKAYTHLAPELLLGSCPQSVFTDVFSLGQIIGKVAAISREKQLKSIAKLCVMDVARRPSMLYVHDSMFDLT